MTTPRYQRLWRTTTRLEYDLLFNNNEEDKENESLQHSDHSGSQDLELISNHQSDDVSDDDSESMHSNVEEDSCESCSSNEDLSDDFDIDNVSNFATELQGWACRTKCTRSQLTELLGILRSHNHPELPVDARTLLKTPRTVECVENCGGQFIYLGIKNGIKRCFEHLSDFPKTHIELQVNADGVPLFKSTGIQVWPILGLFEGSYPFLIAVFCGDSKPNSCEDFLKDFLEEYEQDGLTIGDQHYTLKLHSVICDSPARQFLKCVKGHGGFHACERCTIKGEKIEHRMVFISTSQPLRTDEIFDNHGYPRHQHFASPLVNSSVKCVKEFPLDYMHLICLGVVKRILTYYKEGPRISRLSQNQLAIISERLQGYRGKMPSEFARQPRGLAELKRFKATEFREFLLYLFIVLRGIIQEPVYEHFLTLVVALRILLEEDKTFRNDYLDYAGKLLTYFVNQAPKYYGLTFVVYNVHCLIHLADDSRFFNLDLDKISCFPFENYLQSLKKYVRNSTNPLSSIIKRVSELEQAGLHVDHKTIYTKVSSIKRDSWFLLKNERVVCVKEVLSTKSFVCTIYYKNHVTDFFDKPCRSSLVGIFFLSQRASGKQEVVKKEDFLRKLVCLPREDGFVLIKLLHNVNFKQ